MGTFEFSGEKYKQVSRHQKEWGNKLISELSLKGSESILDLGCGDGVLSEQLAQLVPQGDVLGIDASIGMIETAKEEYERMVQNIGFAEVSVTEENADRYFVNADEMTGWLDQPSLVPFMKFLPDHTKEMFRKEVIEEMLEKTLQADGTCFETFRRIKVYAKA